MNEIEVGDLVELLTSVAAQSQTIEYGIVLEVTQRNGTGTSIVYVDGTRWLIANYHLRKIG